MDYRVESEFYHSGLKCVVIMTKRGYRCGYVGVPKEHPLYGKYGDNKIGKFADIKNRLMKKLSPINVFCMAFEELEDDSPVRIDCYFNVHGGITYSGDGKGTYPIESDLWWFGYDCGHAGDGKDLSIVDERIREIELKYPTFGIVRSLEYCRDECKNLAEQLSNIK